MSNQPLQASAAGLSRYQDDRFGMFIHWGLYSIVGAHEWSMFHDRYSIDEYEGLMKQFRGEQFDADAWVRVAADSGQRFITITSRHHDGFSMYDTALTDYKVTNTPFGRDPMAELREACDRHGVRLGFYVSLLDWHHPAYRAALRERSGLAWQDYVGFLHGQVEELSTRYGDIAEYWIDGYWPAEWATHRFKNWFGPSGDFDFPGMYEMIHRLQPDAVIMHNHHSAPAAGEDVQGFEGDLPGQNSNVINVTAPVLTARETCQTVSKIAYGFHKDDHHYRDVRELLTMLVRGAGLGANFLLNVGPTPQGTFPRPAVQNLHQIGEWLRRNGEGIYGTRAGTLQVADVDGREQLRDAFATTVSTDGHTHYVHLLNGDAPTSFFVDLPDGQHAKTIDTVLLTDGEPVNSEIRGDGDTVRITVPAERREALVTTVRLRVA
ncbi:alpha-L-fucosidase [Dactylosporangium sp. NPDC048998]|uniref:alpha-L-fucosidase n=1 Tax=Dactylosporangium sp. NPDC048998 TaxID=3363976 RepID=UPI003714B7CF